MTAIAAIWTPTAIIVAADSKVTSSDDNDIRQIACKIHQENKIFFAVTGLIEKDETKFDAISLIRRACNQSGQLNDKIKTLEHLVSTPLIDALQYSYDHERDYYKEHLKSNLALGVFFFGIEGNNLFLSRLGYQTKLRGNKIKLEPFPRADLPTRTVQPRSLEAFFSHEGETLERFKKIMPPVTWLENPAKAAEEFILFAGKNHSGIAPPIDIIEVRIDGAKWIQCKECCPEIIPFNNLD